MFRFRTSLSACLFALFLLNGCSSGSSGSAATTLPITVALSNTDPSIDAGSQVNLTAGVANDSSISGVSWTVNGSGTLGGQSTTQATYVAPAGLSSAITATVTATSIKDTTKSASSTITINPAISFPTQTLPTGSVGTSYSATLNATGGTGTRHFAVTAGTLPAGLSLSNAGVLSGTPMAAASGSITVSISDDATTAVSVTQTFSLSIANSIAITSTAAPYATAGKPYSYTLAATGASGTITWSIASGTLPGGLSLSTAGVVSGTPTAATTNADVISVRATDATGLTATANLSLNIAGALTVPASVSVARLVDTTASVGSTGGVGPYTYTVVSGTLPTGLALSSAGVFSGTTVTLGSYPIQLTVTDAGTATATASAPARQTVTSNLTINVTNGTLIITSQSLPPAVVGAEYTASIYVEGMSGTGTLSLTYSFPSGVAPAGLNFSSGGVVRGYPVTAQTLTVGVTATYTGAGGTQTATKNLNLIIGTKLPSGPDNNLLSGSYAFLLRGGAMTRSLIPPSIELPNDRDTIGSMSFDGVGAVSGIVDVNDSSGTYNLSVPITGSYFVDTDRRGLIVLSPSGSALPDYTVLRIVLSDPGTSGKSSTIHLQKFDFDPDKSVANRISATGDARLQTLPSGSLNALTGNYVVGVAGPAFSAAGLLRASGEGNITGTIDYIANIASTFFNPSSTAAIGTYSAPSSATGRGTMAVSVLGSVVYYVISPSEMLFMAVGQGLAGFGEAQQGATFANGSFSGKSVAYTSSVQAAETVDGFSENISSTSISVFNADGSGSLTADNETAINAQHPSSFGHPVAHTYSIDSNGRLTYTDNPYSPLTLYFYDTNKAFGVGSLLYTQSTSGLITMEAQTTAAPSAFSGPFTIRSAYTPFTGNTTSGIAVLTNGLADETIDRMTLGYTYDSTRTWSSFSVSAGGIITYSGNSGVVISDNKAIFADSTSNGGGNIPATEVITILEK